MIMPEKYYPLELDETMQATLLRGFAAQIQQLSFPKLFVLKKIASDIGLVLRTQQEFGALIKPAPEISDKKLIHQQLKSILASQRSETDKLKLIADYILE